MAEDQEKVVNPDRYFNYNMKIGALKGKSFEGVVNEFEKRIRGWYIDIVDKLKCSEDIKNSGFVRMAITNILIDTLCQYFSGIWQSTPKRFVNFLKTRVPEFDKPLKNKGFLSYIDANGIKQEEPTTTFASYADAYYDTFRCGLLHQSRIKNFGRASKATEMVSDFKWDKDDTVEIWVDPDQLFDRIKEIFDQYIKDLKNLKDPSKNDLRKKFKRKILYDFGWKIPLL